jgi:hypothetical protein
MLLFRSIVDAPEEDSSKNLMLTVAFSFLLYFEISDLNAREATESLASGIDLQKLALQRKAPDRGKLSSPFTSHARFTSAFMEFTYVGEGVFAELFPELGFADGETLTEGLFGVLVQMSFFPDLVHVYLVPL